MLIDVEPSATTTFITFEQPLNEHLRICLRLEQLLNQLNEYLSHQSARGSQMALITLLRIIDVIDRPDIKSKLMQNLTQYATSLGQLERFPQVDVERLKNILAHLDDLIQQLHHMQGRIGEPLRANEFLSQLRPQLAHPGGIFLHHAPPFALWLKQPLEWRTRELEQWAQALKPLPAVANLVLELTRQCSVAQRMTTTHGFYHQPLDTTLPCHMIRVAIPDNLGVYAEISAGKHRLSIRFLKPNYLTGDRPVQIAEPITFWLTCCRF